MGEKYRCDHGHVAEDFCPKCDGRYANCPGCKKLQSDLDPALKRVKHLENAIYMAAEESIVDGQGHFCRYCMATLDEYSQGHKKDCVYLSCIPASERYKRDAAHIDVNDSTTAHILSELKESD